ncbi:hypothetical protein OROMI_012514 [Orobanche minor]
MSHSTSGVEPLKSGEKNDALVSWHMIRAQLRAYIYKIYTSQP